MSINKRSTMKQVAKAAGVSTQTVSRVINERPDVAPQTRDRIRKVIAEIGYQPSALARSLIQQRSYTLGVVTAGLKYNGPARTLNGITSQAEELGYAMLLKELPRFDTETIEPIFQNLLSHHVDGIVWAVPQVGDNRRWVTDTLIDLPVPVVFITMESRQNLPIIAYDNFLGGKMAVEHLLQEGYRRIGHISGPLDWWESRQRRAGWEAALTGWGIEPQKTDCTEGNWSSASGEAAFRQLLEQSPDLDAVFVGNDQMALSVVRAATLSGRKIPAQFGVVGFDGLPETAYYSPPLTTIVQDQHQLGSQAVVEIVRLIQNLHAGHPSEETAAVLLKPELIVRESSTRLHPGQVHSA